MKSTIYKNPAWEAASQSPLLSILVPYFRFDCSRLVSELCEQIQQQPDRCELLLVDDGGCMEPLNQKLGDILHQAQVPVHWEVFTENAGRSIVRNRLIRHARGEYLLFLDCDMLPDSEEFLSRYIAAIKANPEVSLFIGGRSYRRLSRTPADFRLYRYFSQRTECIPADHRQRHPAWYVYTNNMVVKGSVARELHFDSDFRGWGYEDTEWGIRVAKRGEIHHLENTATHLGLISDQDLLAKYRESAANYLRILERHPDDIRQFRVSRLALKLSKLRLGLSRLTNLAAWLSGRQHLPLPVRYAALQAFRAGLYARALAASSVNS